MKNNLLRLICVVVFICICLVVFISRNNTSKNFIIDMTGNNGIWSASLNINTGYSNEIVVAPATTEFEFPPSIIVEVFVKDKKIFTDMNVRPSDNGVYKCRFDSNKYLEKHYKDVYLVIGFDDEESKVSFTLISYP